MATNTIAHAESAHAAIEQTRPEVAEQAEKDALALLAIVSHELGSSLTVIKGNIASIRRSLEGLSCWSEELGQREDDVEFAVQRISALQDELLAASHHEPRELELAPLHLDRGVRRVVRSARIAAIDKQLTLTEEYAANFPYAMGDAWAVDCVVDNLVSNAIRYTPPGGSISIRTYNEGDGVAVAVTDTGIGISRESQQRIFERFYRAPEAQKLAPYGLGVGLALVRELVFALGGTMEVESQPGAGSNFKVILPLASMATDDDGVDATERTSASEGSFGKNPAVSQLNEVATELVTRVANPTCRAGATWASESRMRPLEPLVLAAWRPGGGASTAIAGGHRC